MYICVALWFSREIFLQFFLKGTKFDVFFFFTFRSNFIHFSRVRSRIKIWIKHVQTDEKRKICILNLKVLLGNRFWTWGNDQSPNAWIWNLVWKGLKSPKSSPAFMESNEIYVLDLKIIWIFNVADFLFGARTGTHFVLMSRIGNQLSFNIY